MRTFALLILVTALIASGAALAIKSVTPAMPAAASSIDGIEDVHRLVDVNSLPVMQVTEPF